MKPDTLSLILLINAWLFETTLFNSIRFWTSFKSKFSTIVFLFNHNNKQKIIVIGDSHTGGPFTSNNKVYYNVLKKILDEKNIICTVNFNFYWSVNKKTPIFKKISSNDIKQIVKSYQK